MSVKDIEDLDELKEIISNTDELVIVEFFAHWCGPCSMIAPEFERLATEIPDAVFLRVDVENSKDIASAYEVMSMPTFVFFRTGLKVEHLVTGKVEMLEETLKANL